MSETFNTDVTAEELLLRYNAQKTEDTLANAFCVADNQYWSIAVDMDEEEKEYHQYEKLLKEWGSVRERLTQRIIEIMESEGINVSDKGQTEVVISFMERNGFLYSDGWWLKAF